MDPQNPEVNVMTDNTHRAETGQPGDPKTGTKAFPRSAGHWPGGSLPYMELPLSVSFGSLEMPLEDVFKLETGSVVELDASVNDPVTVIVNHTPIARGEMLVIGDNYGIRILEIENTADRIRSLK